MKIICCLTLFFSFTTFAFGQKFEQYSSIDLRKLKNLPELWERYWNMHEMDSMGTMLHDDVDFVNVAGRWLKGKAETIGHHKSRHLGVVFKNSVWTTDSVDIRYITSNLAVIHLSWGLSGDNDPDGTPRKARHGIFTWLVIKEDKDWKILIVQNTNKTY